MSMKYMDFGAAGNRRLQFFLSLFLVALCGCGESAVEVTTVSGISGTVNFDGKPVSEGEVNFISQDRGAVAKAVLNAEGKFSFDEPLEVGKYSVSVSPPEFTTPPGEGPVPELKGFPNIPDGYWDEYSSGLVAEVKKEGENTFTFDLKPGGPPPNR